jgi:hypothetical protein
VQNGYQTDHFIWRAEHGRASSPMKKALISVTFLGAFAAVRGQIDQVCVAFCSILAIQEGAV